jgi:hypothetical protein
MCNCKDQNQCKCLDGKNAFTKTTASFIQPACNANVTINVKDSEFAVVGQPLFIENGGQYEVVSKTNTTITIKNLCGPNNVNPGLTVPSKSEVSPSGFNGDQGIQGPAGNPSICNSINSSFVLSGAVTSEDETSSQHVLTSTITGDTVVSYSWSLQGASVGVFISTIASVLISVLNPNQVIIAYNPTTLAGETISGLLKLTVVTENGCSKDFYYLFTLTVPLE